MNRKAVLNVLGRILLYFSLVFIIPIAVAFYFGESIKPFLISMATSIFLGSLFYFASRKAEIEIRYKEGYAIVGLGWLLVSMVGAIPYLFVGLDFFDAFFEAMSGFTTTGATVFDSVENLPKSVLTWRSLTQWLGGMGIIVLFVAILPSLAKSGYALMQAEVPGIKLTRLKPRLRDTAIALYLIYLFFTLLEAAILKSLGVSLFDAINHAFTTLSTGGFSTHTESIAYYNNPAIEATIFVFMIIGGTNFALFYYIFNRNFKILKDAEFKAYILILLTASVILTVINFEELNLQALRYSFFQAASIMTTTGYTTADFDQWSDAAKILLLMLMFIGGSSGSTGGGIKVIRIYLLSAYSLLQIMKSAEPRTVRVVKYGEEVVEREAFSAITSFFSLYIMIFAISSFLISLFGYDLLTSISAVAACINNVGPGMGLVGASESYSALHDYAKLILSINMWVGRLEVFTVLALFIPSFWREKW
ncbi:TrkH family potassium uptake protein [Ferroglobus sp.]|uniref:TrkH family potassium uptake protein n=1 Tax=Ferroglobus sp. TaxID=2614230 RepID=UPI0025BBF905|nr:TrkH family potassium uptake protein [Ferroglobus sp.]